MVAIARTAVEIPQGHLTFYLTYVTPAELTIPNFYDVEQLEPSGGGFQRVLNPTRANRLSRYLAEGFPSGYANLPTTIFLATDKELSFDPAKNELSFDTDEVCPFSVVDGQHRIAGLIRASKNQPGLKDFKLPATVAVDLDGTHQMYHFYIVNTTQEPVEAALRQQITRRFTDMKGVYDLPYLPHWLERKVAGGTDAYPLRLAEFLNESAASPLQGRVQMANDVTPLRNRIKQASLVTILRDNVFTANNPITMKEPEPEKRQQIMLNYFRAVDGLFVSPDTRATTVVYKTNGIFFFTYISRWVFLDMYAAGLNFTEDSIAQTLKGAVDEMDHPFQNIAEPSWWLPGYGASLLNRANSRLYANEFVQALGRSQKPESRS